MKFIALLCIFSFTLIAPNYVLAQNEAQNLEKYYARNEQTRSHRTRSLAYGPQILGFQLFQTAAEAVRNAERLGTEYIIHAGNPRFPVKNLRDAKYIDILISQKLANEGRNIFGGPLSRRGHFEITIINGYVARIYINRAGLSMFYYWEDYFMPAISRVMKINIPCNVQEGRRAIITYDYYCQARGNRWYIRSLEYGNAMELVVSN